MSSLGLGLGIHRGGAVPAAPFARIFGSNYYDDWDFDDSDRISLTGSAIESITSKGVNGAILTASGTARPTLVSNDINGKDVASFDGVTDVMSVATSTAMYKFLHYGQGAIILVTKVNNTSATGVIVRTTTSTASVGFELYKNASEIVTQAIYPANPAIITVSSASATGVSGVYSSWVIYNDTENATAANKLKMVTNNGAARSNAAAGLGTNSNTTQNFGIGARAVGTLSFSGNIARLIVVNTLPTADQLTAVQTQLTLEYGTFPI